MGDDFLQPGDRCPKQECPGTLHPGRLVNDPRLSGTSHSLTLRCDTCGDTPSQAIPVQ